VAGCDLAGAGRRPNILLLMPAWLAGVTLHRLQPRLSLTPPTALMLFLGSAAVYLVLLKFDIGARLAIGYSMLRLPTCTALVGRHAFLATGSWR